MDSINIDKVQGCMAGISIGDAMGMPTSLLTPQQIKNKFGYVETFLDAGDDHSIHNGLGQGVITDDTQQTLLVANAIIQDGKVTIDGVVNQLLRWANENQVIHSTIIGPSTKMSLIKLMDGADPIEAGMYGDTNGSAMRIAPVGIVNAGNLPACIEESEKASLPSHGTNIGISSACAVACAVAQAMTETSLDKIIEAAIYGARQGEGLGRIIPGPSIARRIELAVELVDRAESPEQAALDLYDLIGAGVRAIESIPTALGLVYAAKGDPMEAIILATNIGDDSDTIASMAGGICGAYAGIERFPSELVAQIMNSNELDLNSICQQLTDIANRRLKQRR